MKFVLAGAGNRGMIYAGWLREKGYEISAVADLKQDRLDNAVQTLNVPRDGVYHEAMDLFAAGKLGDVAIIATMDRGHYQHAMAALDCGYDLLLEKPISPDGRECLEIEAKAKKLGKKVTVCHVLRYTEFFGTIKSILDSGELGKVLSIKHSENIGNYHMAHSFVRGNWRNSAQSSPIIMQKSCHDMDILLWLTGKHCRKVSAVGSLSYFREENAPQGSTPRCEDCPLGEKCRFQARRVYLPTLGQWPTNMVTLAEDEKGLMEALRTSPYGRCVFRCDNDVCDHMSMLMEFEDGITATFSLTAQSNKMHRHIHIFCEDGEIIADDGPNTIEIVKFAANDVDGYETKVLQMSTPVGGHGGGDTGLMKELLQSLENDSGETKSAISNSVESHMMALAMEESRLSGKTVDIEEFKKELLKK